jgi:hypothetical protein
MISIVADENWITFTLRYVVDYKKRRSTKDQLFSRILAEIDSTKKKISIASTASEISLITTPPLHVNLKHQLK